MFTKTISMMVRRHQQPQKIPIHSHGHPWTIYIYSQHFPTTHWIWRAQGGSLCARLPWLRGLPLRHRKVGVPGETSDQWLLRTMGIIMGQRWFVSRVGWYGWFNDTGGSTWPWFGVPSFDSNRFSSALKNGWVLEPRESRRSTRRYSEVLWSCRTLLLQVAWFV